MFARIILAVFIAISLVVTPLTSALAAMHGTGMPGMTTSADANMDMFDCMKAMAGAQDKAPTDTSKGDCTCCDTKHKCPDAANCMTKCCKIIGALRPAARIEQLVFVLYQLPAPERPPDWISAPPFTPPRS